MLARPAADKGQARRRSNVVQQKQACDEWEEDGRDAAMQARGTAVDKAVDKKKPQDEVPDFLCQVQCRV
jgi:hypothetical protein